MMLIGVVCIAEGREQRRVVSSDNRGSNGEEARCSRKGAGDDSRLIPRR